MRDELLEIARAAGYSEGTLYKHFESKEDLFLAVLAAYFLWCWLRGGQTLAMRAWKIRLVDVTPGKAAARFLIAAALLPLSILWALVDRDGQFLHDRLAGTRLVKA